jgi:hypothetical protein
MLRILFCKFHCRQMRIGREEQIFFAVVGISSNPTHFPASQYRQASVCHAEREERLRERERDGEGEG